VSLARHHSAKNKNQPAPFSFATTHKKALVIHGVTATPDPKELAERKAQADLFTGAVLRDAYLFLLNPASPGVAAPPGPHEAPQHLGAALLGKPSAVSGSLDTFAFVDRAGLPTSLPDGWRLLDEATTLSALDHLGEPSPLPLAATRAFEQYLEEKARAWADAQVARLSVEFLVAFARELTPRLDVHHRMRSRALSQDELLSLSTLPFANGVDLNVLRRYQQPLLPCTPPPPALTMNAQTALGANAAQTVAAPLQPPQQLPPTRPETPGLLPHPLPPSPRAVEPATSTPGSLVSRLFTKVAQ